ncbi:MAG: QcrA and Rieske domain-containing protein [Planctomycetota bacterium]|jgi:Rieske Fe-S protein
MTDNPDNARRNFVRIALIGGVALVSAGAASGAVLLPKETASPDNSKRPLMPISKLPEIKAGRPLEVEISLSRRDAWRLRTSTQRVYLLRSSAGDDAKSFTALSSVCPHAGCRIELEEKEFHCHCHGAKFDFTGRVTDDPSPRDMDELELVEIKEYKGEPWLFVRWIEYESGTEDKRVKGQA